MQKYFLFANPSFIEGMARVLDLGTTLNEYNTSLTPEEADHEAMASDWKAVASDLKAAMAEHERRLTSHG